MKLIKRKIVRMIVLVVALAMIILSHRKYRQVVASTIAKALAKAIWDEPGPVFIDMEKITKIGREEAKMSRREMIHTIALVIALAMVLLNQIDNRQVEREIRQMERQVQAVQIQCGEYY